MKKMKTNRKKSNTPNTFMTSQRLDEMLFMYFRSCACAESTLASVSSMFSSMRIVSSPCSWTCKTETQGLPSSEIPSDCGAQSLCHRALPMRSTYNSAMV